MALERRRQFVEISPIEQVLLRQKLDIGHYHKSKSRNPEKHHILLQLALEKARQADHDFFEKVGVRRRRVNLN